MSTPRNVRSALRAGFEVTGETLTQGIPEIDHKGNRKNPDGTQWPGNCRPALRNIPLRKSARRSPGRPLLGRGKWKFAKSKRRKS